jgi:phosphoglycolate phosphatase
VVEAPCDRVLMIGDRRHDIEAGLRHGTRTAGVTWGFGDRAELEAAGAHELVDEPAALVPIVTS